jgi:hypothetical protein
MSRHARNLLGQRFGRLVVLERAGSNNNAIWLCACDCEKEVIVPSNRLVQGLTRSCGCLRREMSRERMSTHRMSRTREYRSYQSAKSRCTNPKVRVSPTMADAALSFASTALSRFSPIWKCVLRGRRSIASTLTDITSWAISSGRRAKSRQTTGATTAAAALISPRSMRTQSRWRQPRYDPPF